MYHAVRIHHVHHGLFGNIRDSVGQVNCGCCTIATQLLKKMFESLVYACIYVLEVTILDLGVRSTY